MKTFREALQNRPFMVTADLALDRITATVFSRKNACQPTSLLTRADAGAAFIQTQDRFSACTGGRAASCGVSMIQIEGP